MKSFMTYLAEANAVGAKFEKKVAQAINEWLDENGLASDWEAKRFQTVDEAESRDEDYSDVIVEKKDGSERFFVECKEADRANVVNAKFEFTDDGLARTDESDDTEFALALTSTDDWKTFKDFFTSENDLLSGLRPSDLYFGKTETDSKILNKLITAYNKLVDSGNVEADCKKFDKRNIRPSTRGTLATALAWRLSDQDRTWDICSLETVPNFGRMMRSHYTSGKAEPAKYVQFNDKLFRLDPDSNPLNLKDIPMFPDAAEGKFTLKFTPRFGTGSIYVTPRSEIISEFESSYSFTDKAKWPEFGLNEAEAISDNSVYLASMAKSFPDKAWFLKFIPDYIDTIVDFGGGAGEFCEYLESKAPGRFKYAVIDNNDGFLSSARKKGFVGFTDLTSLRESGLNLSKAMLNMSSVIHEVYAYSDPFFDDPGVFWNEIGKCGFGVVVIRDMSMSDTNYKNIPADAVIWIRENVFLNPVYSVKGYSLPDLTRSFEEEWGPIVNNGNVNAKNLLHFLTKYRYGGNWAREVKENYFPISQDRLEKILKSLGFKLTHKESSKLPFYAKQWDKDFKLNRPSPNDYKHIFSNWLKTLNTHIKWMAEK